MMEMMAIWNHFVIKLVKFRRYPKFILKNINYQLKLNKIRITMLKITKVNKIISRRRRRILDKIWE